MEPSIGIVSVLTVIGSPRGLGREGQDEGRRRRRRPGRTPSTAHFLVKPRLHRAGQVPRYPPPREGSAIGDNYASPSHQTAETVGFGRFGHLCRIVVRRFRPGRGRLLPAFLPVLRAELWLPGLSGLWWLRLPVLWQRP